MRNLRRTLAACVLAAMLAPPAFAAGHDVSGHWEGLLTSVIGPQEIALDVARGSDGALKGTLSSSELDGLPLASVSQAGNKVQFALPDALAITFAGDLDPTGDVLTGIVSTPQGEAAVTLTRDGDAELPAPITNSRVDPRLEGAWDGAVDIEGRHMRVRLTLANQADGTARGVMASLDEGFESAVTIAGDPAKLVLKVKVTGGEWDGALSPSGDTLAGTYTTRGMTFPMALKRP